MRLVRSNLGYRLHPRPSRIRAPRRFLDLFAKSTVRFVRASGSSSATSARNLEVVDSECTTNQASRKGTETETSTPLS